MNWLLTGILIANVALLIVFCVLLGFVFTKYTEAKSKYNAMIKWWQWFIRNPDEKTPAPWQEQLQSLAALAAHAIIVVGKQELQTTIGGIASGNARSSRAQGIQEALNNAPGWMRVLSMFLPGRTLNKFLPFASVAASLGSHSSAPGASSSTAPGGDGSVKFKL